MSIWGIGEAEAKITRGLLGNAESRTTAGLIITWEVVVQITMKDVVILWP